MTDRILEFLRNRREDGPCLVLDLDVVRENYMSFAKAMPDTRVFYAVKANPDPRVLDTAGRLGSCFDAASVAEIEQVLAAGAAADRISYGNTIKKERDIKRAYELGVRLFAVDCEAEVEKIARAAPGSKVFCRMLCDGAGAEWPLSRKFGCAPRWRRACSNLRTGWGSSPSACRFMSARSSAIRACGTARLKAAAAIFRDLVGSRHQSADGQSRRRLSDEIFEECAGGENLCAGDFSFVAAAFRQSYSRDDHRAGPRHGRQRRRDRGGSRADLAESRTMTR